MKEIWKNINNFPGYQISNIGRVKSITRTLQYGKTTKIYQGQMLSPRPVKKGYLQIPLQKQKKTIRKLIHRLVLEHFHRPPKTGEEADHINRIKYDNRITNLRWVTKMENMRNVDWSDRRKLSHKDVADIRNNSTHRYCELANIYGVHPSIISKIKNFKRRTIHLQNSVSA